MFQCACVPVYRCAHACVHTLVHQGKVIAHANLQAIFMKKENTLRGLDRSWKIEMALMSDLSSEGGQRALESQFLQLLPTQTTSNNVKDVLLAVDALKGTQLYKFVGPNGCGSIDAAMELLNSIRLGRPPQIPVTSSPFLSQVVLRLAFFCTYTAKNDKGKPTGTPQTGAQAATKALTELKKMDKKTLTLGDIEIVVVFKWLLNDTDKNEVDKLVTNVVKDQTSTAPKRGSSQGAPKQAAKKNKVDKSAMDEALVMFS